MPIDPSFLPALEEELWMAKRLKPGGQPVDPGRVAAIEAQIKLHKAAAKKPEPEPENQSDVSTDYESHDAKPDKVKSARANAKAERADVDKRDEETTDA